VEDAAGLAGLLMEEPLWEQGYLLLAERLLAQGESAAAAEWSFLGCRLRPTAAMARMLLSAATSADVPGHAAHAREILARDRDHARQEARAERARFGVEWGRRLGDPFITCLYADWLRGRGLASAGEG